MNSKNKKNKQITEAEKQQLETAKKALSGGIPSLKELERKLGPEEFERRCEKLLKAIFESNDREKVMTAAGLKAKARAHVEKSQEAYRNCCTEFYKALDCLFTLSVRVEGAEKAGSKKVVPEMGLGYGMGVENMKKAVARLRKPVQAEKARKPSHKDGDAPEAVAQKAPAVPRTAEAPKVVKEPPLPSSVKISDHEVELHLGSFGAKALADTDAGEYVGKPMVFWYRRGMFPDPRQSRVNPTVISAKAVERKGKAFKGSPWTVHVKIGMAGDAAHCRSWAKGVLARNKGEQE